MAVQIKFYQLDVKWQWQYPIAAIHAGLEKQDYGYNLLIASYYCISHAYSI